MKIKDGFLLRKVAGENVVIPVGRATLELNGIIRLNSTGELLWNKLAETGATSEELAQLLIDTYQIDETMARNDVERFLVNLEPAKCIEE